MYLQYWDIGPVCFAAVFSRQGSISVTIFNTMETQVLLGVLAVIGKNIDVRGFKNNLTIYIKREKYISNYIIALSVKLQISHACDVPFGFEPGASNDSINFYRLYKGADNTKYWPAKHVCEKAGARLAMYKTQQEYNDIKALLGMTLAI